MDGKNVNQGKLGLAILKNQAASDYKLLLYVGKQKPVSMSQIKPSFKFTVILLIIMIVNVLNLVKQFRLGFSKKYLRNIV